MELVHAVTCKQMAAVKKRSHLTPEKKVGVIKAAEGGKNSVRSLAQEFDCDKTQIVEIFKKYDILSLCIHPMALKASK